MSQGSGDKFDWKRIATHLCETHGVRDLPDIHTYGRGAVEAWKLSQPKVIVVEHSIEGLFNKEKPVLEQVVTSLVGKARILTKSLQPDEPFCHPRTGQPMESDLSNVSVCQVACRAYSNTTGIQVQARMNWRHETQAKLDGLDITEAAFTEAGAIQGVFTVLDPSDKEETIQSFPLPELEHGYQNGGYAQTFRYLNSTNIRNGLVVIPEDVCREAKLPIWSGPPAPSEDFLLKQLKSLKITDLTSAEAESAKKQISVDYGQQFMEQYYKDDDQAKPITYYIAVPADHVLAWGYASDEYRSDRGHRGVFHFTYRLTPESDAVLLYYLVPNVLVEHSLEELEEAILGKADVRSLNDLGMEFMPYESPPDSKFGQATPVHGKVSLRTYYSYMSGPRLTQATIDALAPTRSPNMPPCQNWNREEMARKRALEEYERQNK